jgi:hypothetical protein
MALWDTGDVSAHSGACVGIFYTYQQLLRIATQRRTQASLAVDFIGVFLQEHSLRNGVTAYT